VREVESEKEWLRRLVEKTRVKITLRGKKYLNSEMEECLRR